jgi:hypothetical protein
MEGFRFNSMRRYLKQPRTGRLQIQKTSPYAYLRADSYIVTGSKVLALVDCVRAGTGIKAITSDHTMTQSDDALQCVLPTSASEFNGKPALTFSSHCYQSSSPASSWKIHDGTGWEVFHVFAPTGGAGNEQFQLSTTVGSTGIYLYSPADATQYSYFLTRNVGTAVVDQHFASCLLSASTGYCVNFYYSETNPGHDFKFQNRPTGLSVSTNSTSTPASTDPTQTLVLGALSAAGASPMKEKWAATIIYNRVLTDAERTRVFSAITQEYRIL